MILMYHHVCPQEKIPEAAHCVPIEGWRYHLTPEAFAFQLTALKSRGWHFVSMDDYLAGVVDGSKHKKKLAAVTFDDGWIDNRDWALGVLQKLDITAAFFIVSGPMEGVPAARRMNVAMLRELQQCGMTIGAHTRTHPNLASLSAEAMRDEIHGSRSDLEDVLGTKVDLLAYPGGRFNRAVAETARAAGFRAACSTLPGGGNGPHSRYWLYREVFSPELATFRDRVLLHPAGRWIQGWRTRRSVKRRLLTGSNDG